MRSVGDLEAKNLRFWSAITEPFIAVDEDIILHSIEMHRSEVRRGVGFREQHPIDYFVHQSLKNLPKARTALARQGGRAKKGDALARFIDAAVRADSAMTVARLKEKLKVEQALNGWLWEVNDTEIVFEGPRGAEKTAPVSGLNNRLLRARKKLDSR